MLLAKCPSPVYVVNAMETGSEKRIAAARKCGECRADRRADNRRARELYAMCAEREMIVFWHCGPAGIEPGGDLRGDRVHPVRPDPHLADRVAAVELRGRARLLGGVLRHVLDVQPEEVPRSHGVAPHRRVRRRLVKLPPRKLRLVAPDQPERKPPEWR